ncbi:hypothetical protein L7F22_036436 [Adiantum nelumboides]|nr:hypothetical protein [Adiantum nelumboides]
MATSFAKQLGRPPYSVKVDPEDALELVKHGASLLVLDMPPNTFLGFDLHVLSVGPLFKGVKMIPPGPHFVYYSPSSRHGANQPFFTGFFIHPDAGDVFVRRWDPHFETLVKLSDPDEEERYQASVRNFDLDRHLGAYDLHHHHTWKRLTSHITPQVIERLEPVASNISVMHEADYADKLPQTAAECYMNQHLDEQREVLSNRQAAIEAQAMARTADDDMVLDKAGNGGFQTEGPCSRYADGTSMSIDYGTGRQWERGARQDAEGSTFLNKDAGRQSSDRCFYTRFPYLVRRRGVTGSVLTMLNVDKSAELDYLLENQYGGAENVLLGELQFSFIAFLMGQSLESFGQWKSIVCLMLSCNEAPLSKHTQMFVAFLDIVCFQLLIGLRNEELSDVHSTLRDTLIDKSWFSDDNFLRARFKEFYQLVIEAQPVDGDLLKQTRRLKRLLETSIGWSFDIKEGDISNGDDDEYAPVIVPESELSGYC